MRTGEVRLDEITIKDVEALCHDIIAGHNEMDGNKKAKNYFKQLAKVSKKLETAMDKGKEGPIDKAFAKYFEFVRKVSKLKPGLTITDITQRDSGMRIFDIERASRPSNVTNLVTLFASAKNNILRNMEQEKTPKTVDRHREYVDSLQNYNDGKNGTRLGVVEGVKNIQKAEQGHYNYPKALSTDRSVKSDGVER